jgi:hypothetical protein
VRVDVAAFLCDSRRDQNTVVELRQELDLLDENEIVNWRGICYNDHAREGSTLSFSPTQLTKSFPILFEILGCVVVDLVLFQEGVDLHTRPETKKSPELRRR